MTAFAQDKYDPTYESTGYGVRDVNGNVLLPFEYDYLSFEGGNSERFTAEKNGKAGVINVKGEVVLPFDYESLYFLRVVPGILLAKKNGKYNLMELGKPEPKFIYDEIEQTFGDSEFCVVRQNGKEGLINAKGTLVVPLKYEEVHQVEANKQWLVVKEKGLWGIIDIRGKVVLDVAYKCLNGECGTFRFDGRTAYFEENSELLLSRNGKWGVITPKGNIKVPFDYDFMDYFTYGEDNGIGIVVKKNGKYGIINNENKVVLPPRFIEYFGAFKEHAILGDSEQSLSFWSVKGTETKNLSNLIERNDSLHRSYLAKISKNGKFGLLDANAKLLIPLKYDGISHIQYSPSELWIYKNGDKYGLFTQDGVELTKAIYDEIASDNHYDFYGLKVRTGDKWGIVDFKGKIIVPLEYEETSTFNNGAMIASVKKDGLYALINSKGKFITGFEFEEIDIWGGFNLTCLKKNGKYGYANGKGEMLTPCHFDNKIADFRTDYFLVSKDGKFGYLDRNCKMVTPIKYDSASEMGRWDTFGRVTLNGKTGYVYMNGVEHWD